MESPKLQELTVGDVMRLIKGFVDMLILASGYQSSGLFAHWDSSNLKNAFKWALFFENIFRHLVTSSKSDGFLNELDSSLSELRSNPVLPQGLTCISAGILSRARNFLVESIVHPLPLRDEHLKALLVVSTELDLDELKGKSDHLNVFLDKLMLLNSSLPPASPRRFTDVSSLQEPVQDMEIVDGTVDHTRLTVQELLKRKSAASCLLSAENSLLILSSTFDLDHHSLSTEGPNHAAVTLSETVSYELTQWNKRRCQILKYFLGTRTVQLVSGASLIFSAPKAQWVQVFKQLSSSPKAGDTNLLEILVDDTQHIEFGLEAAIELICAYVQEIMLLGCISSEWECIVRYLTSVSYDSLTTSKQYLELWNSLQGRSRNFHNEMETADPKVKDILAHLTELVGDSQRNQLWKLPPVLLAAAIPSWSPLLRSYLSELGSQLKGKQISKRNYDIMQDKEDRIDGDLDERIWCLYIFHTGWLDKVQKTSTG